MSANIIPRPFDLNDLNGSAITVASRLNEKGYEAYVVGGAVRDLMLGKTPKDFDVATNATPEQIAALFRGARIVGRRFQIVHVRMGREIIEVTTFRGDHESADSKDKNQARRGQTGVLLRDNVFGTLEQDAIRRDLTINALYYDPVDDAVIDYTNGLSDIENKLLKLIGDPVTRYQEDPVRMLRVIRFQAKLGFEIELQTANAIQSCAKLLAQIPAARLFDEFLKGFMAGDAAAFARALMATPLWQELFPDNAQYLNKKPEYRKLLTQALINTDQRINSGKGVTPAFLLAAILWPAVDQAWEAAVSRGEPPIPAMNSAGQDVILRAITRVAVPKRFSMVMRDIWDLQMRMDRRRHRKPLEFASNKRFRAAYDFLLLRAEAGEPLQDIAHWWTEFQDKNPQLHELRAAQPAEEPVKRRRPPRRRRRPS